MIVTKYRRMNLRQKDTGDEEHPWIGSKRLQMK